jgi:hypothetical protein
VAQLFSLGSIARTMKYTPIILGLSLLLTSCKGQDAKVSRQIAGTWEMDAPINMATFSWTNPVVRRWTISSDGSFSQSLGHVSALVTYQGTWLVRDGELVLTFTNALGTGDHTPDSTIVGRVRRCKIVHVDDHQFVIHASVDTNTIITLTR